jgi:tetratricopeptide (TPR) repeat protein
MSGSVRLLMICLLLTLSSAFASGQDLGSSNKLFGGTTSKSPASTAKKAPVKRKPAPAKAKRSTTAKSKPLPKAASTAKKAANAKPVTEATAKKAEPVVIKTGTGSTKTEPKTEKPAVVNPPSNAAAELYEKLIDNGNAARDDRNYAAAEAAYKRANENDPRDARAVFGLGNLYTDQQRWDEAEKAYRSAIKIEPDNAIFRIALSYVLSQPIAANNLGDRYEEAERLAQKAAEIEPQNALAFDQLGVAMELRGLISAETENAYRTAIRLDPTFAPPYAHLGRLLRRKGRGKESSDAYDNAVRYSTDVATMILVADVM